MRQTQLVNQKAEGFTLIEVLMAVLLIAILATIAITQFTNFARDTRNASTKENLGILRNAIQKHYGTMRLRCGVTNTDYPTVAAVTANDITAAGPCSTNTAAIPETDRYFAAGGIPENPWSDRICTPAQRRTVLDGSGIANANMNVGVDLADGDLQATVNCGWVYNPNTGRIKANSKTNGLDQDGLTESAY